MSRTRSPLTEPRRRRRSLRRGALPLVLLAGLTVACSEEPPATPTGPVENAELGLTVAALPSDCTVQRNEGRDLVLACGSRRGTTGEVLFQVSAEGEGVNLPELARGQKEAFEAMPEGKFFGNRELVTPSGPAYTARGRYVEEGKALEEIRVLALHPSSQSLLVVRSRYPEGDETAKRMEQLLLIVGEVGAAGAAPTEPAATS